MKPDDSRQPVPPSGPPPRSLPRPSTRIISDIQGMQRPPRPTGATPPRPPLSSASPASSATTTAPSGHVDDHLIDAPHEALIGTGIHLDEPPTPRKKRSIAKRVAVVLIALLVLVAAAAVAAVWWYQEQLKPVDTGSSQHVRVGIDEGSSPASIGETLRSSGVIRNKTAFAVYIKLSGTENSLKAGTYSLKKNESVQEIVDHLVSGKQDTFSLTFLPGDTLANNRKKLIAAGYSVAEVDAALAKHYDRPLFAGKPSSADLEGYIFGDTYEFTSDASVETILSRTFDEYEKYITANNLVDGFKKQNLSLYQGITLASIVQREVTNHTPNTPTDDQKQVARVFYNRMKAGMTLGSDVTYQYAARKLGIDPSPTLDSPYNTRIHTGLPPGPIATPGLGALIAVANPGTNDYLFFLSGDDDVTYFAKTDAEHQQNVANHCKKKCLIN